MIFDRILQYSSMLVFILVYFVQNDLIMADSKHFLSHFEDRWGFFWTLCASFGIFNCCFRVFHSIFIVFHFIFIFRDLYLLFLKAIHGDSKTQFKNSASILWNFQILPRHGNDYDETQSINYFSSGINLINGRVAKK